MQTKTITMLLLIAIAVGMIGTTIEMGLQSAQGQAHLDTDDIGKGKSFHDSNGDLHSHNGMKTNNPHQGPPA